MSLDRVHEGALDTAEEQDAKNKADAVNPAL